MCAKIVLLLLFFVITFVLYAKLKPLPLRKLNLETVNAKFNFKIVSPGDIKRIIMAKITSGSTGPDGIPPKVYKILASQLAASISIIINSTFNHGYFPTALKNISITALPKVGNPTKLSDFRPISNANFLLKIMSTVSCEQLTKYIEENKLLSIDQFGFRKFHSCTSAILRITEEFQDAISRGKCVVLLLLDFANAYGSVDHNMLLQLLKGYGIGNQSTRWYKSFLNEWKQVVKRDDGIYLTSWLSHAESFRGKTILNYFSHCSLTA